MFRGSPTGKTRLVLPSEWDGQEQLHRAIRNLRALPGGAALGDTDEPHVKTITHAPDQNVHLRYDVVQDWPGGVVKDGLYNRAILQSDYFYFIGDSFWVLPEWEDESPVSVELSWRNVPRGWALANSFGRDRSRQVADTTVYDFRKGVFLGGDFRTDALAISGAPVQVVTRGEWRFPVGQFRQLVGEVVRLHRSFWQDHDFPPFLVVLFPTDNPPKTYSGESRTNACVLYVSREVESPSFLKKLLSHELFHAWNPNRLGALESESLYWFTEGLTDYYASLLLLRGGLISPEEYLAQYNAALKSYYTSPARRLRNEQILGDGRDVEGASRQSYLRGNLLAHLWNARIQANTKGRRSLDDVMRDLLRAGRRPRAVLSAESISRALQRYLGDGARADIARYIDAGELIPAGGDVLGPCAEAHTVEYAPFDPGFDIESSFAKRVFTGVREDSEAYRAGLRNGQKWLKGGLERDPAALSELLVGEGGVQKTIRYYPKSTEVIVVPQYRLRADAPPGLSLTGSHTPCKPARDAAKRQTPAGRPPKRR